MCCLDACAHCPTVNVSLGCVDIQSLARHTSLKLMRVKWKSPARNPPCSFRTVFTQLCDDIDLCFCYIYIYMDRIIVIHFYNAVIKNNMYIIQTGNLIVTISLDIYIKVNIHKCCSKPLEE